MVYVLNMLPVVLKESGKAHVKAMMSWTFAVEGGEVASTNFILRAGLGLVMGGWDMQGLMAGRGFTSVVGGFLHCVHVAMVLKESGKAHFKKMMSWIFAVKGGEVHSTDFILRSGLGLVVRGWEMQCLMAGRGCTYVVGGLLHCVP